MFDEQDDSGGCELASAVAGAGLDQAPAAVRATVREGAAAGGRPANADGERQAVRIRVRRHEVIIEIDPSLLAPSAAPSRRRGVTAEAPWSPGPARPEPRVRPPRALPSVARAPVPAGWVGFERVKADAWGAGYRQFQVRADLVPSYQAVYRQVKALGGVITSSGGVRALSARPTAGRSSTSLHYTGRAIDLFIHSGMQGGTEPYMVTRDGGSETRPEWKVYCVSASPVTSDPLYDASLIEEGELECVRWQRGVGDVPFRRRARYFCLTDVFERQGWTRIPARADWKDTYLSCEWWHFQSPQGLVDGASTFGEQLLQVWPADQVRRSGLALGAVWAGRSFRLTQPTPGGAPGQTDAAEKVRWAQVVLNATAGESLTADGRFGPRTAAAIQRFQMRNGLQPGGALDASTEVALIQRALERIAHATFVRLGVLDDATVEAVKRFQRANRLVADGRVGAKSRAKMTAALTAGDSAPQRSRVAADVPTTREPSRNGRRRAAPRRRTLAAKSGRGKRSTRRRRPEVGA